MSLRRIANLCCRVLAVWAFIDALGDFQMHAWALGFAMFSGPSEWWVQVLSVLTWAMPLLQIALAAWLWWRAGLVAAWMTGHDLEDDLCEPDSAADAVTPEGLATVSFATLGAWMLISGVVMLVTVISSSLLTIDASEELWGERMTLWAAVSIIETMIYLGGGTLLLFGARRLAARLFRERPPAPPPIDDGGAPGDEVGPPLAARLIESRRHRSRCIMLTPSVST